jgi:transaldolase
MMKENPLLKLHSFGQNIWLDYIRRHLIESGELQRLIEEDALCGVTSNPAIFDKAIEKSHDYDDAIQRLMREGRSAQQIYEILTIEDIRAAADLFRPTYERLGGADGFVSLEVNPHLARNVSGTLSEARRLWTELDRPNVFIKVPATLEGLQCIRQLISEGINVNVTLLFSLPRYRMVAQAYLSGLKDRAVKGLPINGVASVASFFLSRIDVLIDPLLQKIADEGGHRAGIARDLKGQIAVSSAKIAYRIYEEIYAREEFGELAAAMGARPQRLLWASTSSKNPEYADVKYVEALIGPETVNTVPLETLDAYRDHGNPAPRLEENVEEAQRCLDRLAGLGIDLDMMTERLENEGIEKFNQPYDSLMSKLERTRAAA